MIIVLRRRKRLKASVINNRYIKSERGLNMNYTQEVEFYRKEITEMIKEMDSVRYLAFIYNLMSGLLRDDKAKETFQDNNK